MLLTVCLLAAFSFTLAHGQTSSITLDSIPSSAYVGDRVTFTGTLHLDGRNPEGAIVYIKDEDTFSGDDLLASAYVDSAGRFTAYWIVANVDPDNIVDIYAVFEGDHASWGARSAEQIMSVLTYGGSLVLDPIPESAALGEAVTLSGTLYLDGHNPEGAIVYIKDEDDFSGDDLLASAYVDSAGRFAAYWIAEDIDPTSTIEVYAVFEGNDRFSRLVSGTQDMRLYFDPLTPDPSPVGGEGYMELYYSMDLARAPRVLIAPSPESYDEVRLHIIPVQEGIIQLTAMLERECEDGIWDVSFEVLDRGRLFASEEPDIVVSIVTDAEDPQCGVDYSGVAWPDNIKPVQAIVCSLEGASNADISATAAHEFIHAIGLGHTFNIAGDMMCSVEDDVPTCEDLYSKSNTPSSLNLAAIVAAYGTDGFSNPNNEVMRGEVFTLVDYQSRADNNVPLLSVSANDDEFEAGDTITITGSIENIDSDMKHAVTIQVDSPDGNRVGFAQATPTDDGEFAVDIPTGGPLWNNSGEYLVLTVYGSGIETVSISYTASAMGLPQDQDYPILESPVGEMIADRWQYEPGEDVFLYGFHFEEYSGEAGITISDPYGNLVDVFVVNVVDGYFAIYIDGYYLPGTYTARLYDYLDDFAASTTFDVTEDILGGFYEWFVLTDYEQYYSGSAMQISGYGPQSDYGPSRVLIADWDGNVVDDLSVYPVAGYFAVTAYLDNSYQPGLYGVWLYDGAGSIIAYTSFEIVGSGTVYTDAIVINAEGSSVPGCEETNECFVPHTVTIGVGGTVT